MPLFVALLMTVFTVVTGLSAVHFWGETETGMAGLHAVLGAIAAALSWRIVYKEYRELRLKRAVGASLKRHIDHS